MSRAVRVRVPASSANLGPGFDVLALALDLHLRVEARESGTTSLHWEGEGPVPLSARNLIVRAARDPFRGWSRPLKGIELKVRNEIPIGRGLGSSAAAIVAGIIVGARLRGLRISPQRVLELGFPLEGHGDNLAAAVHGGVCVVSAGDGGVRVHRLDWPPRWRAVVFVPAELSPTHEARRLVPLRPARADAIFNLGRVAEWVLAVTRRDRSMVESAMQDRLHQPGRSRTYPYLDDLIAAAIQAGALGAALSGAGGSVIAIADRSVPAVGRSLLAAAKRHHVDGRVISVGSSRLGVTHQSSV